MRPQAEPSPQVVAALDLTFQLASRLSSLMEAALSERGLSTARASVLFALFEHGPMVQRRISQILRWTPRYVTGLIDVLEAEEWVKRTSHPTDRRATIITLTTRGAEAAARMHAERLEAANQFFGRVPESSLRTFIGVARKVLAQIEPE